MDQRFKRLASTRPARPSLLPAVALLLSLAAGSAQADALRYRYVSQYPYPIPAPFQYFSQAAMVEGDRIYGTVYAFDQDYNVLANRIAHLDQGVMTVQPQTGWANAANSDGVVGGSVTIDPVNYVDQAALFRDGKTILIGPQPNETYSYVLGLNKDGEALVAWYDQNYDSHYLIYKNGKTRPVTLGNGAPPFFFFSFSPLNEDGLVAGVVGWDKGFRLDTRTGQSTLLGTFPGDPSETIAWGMGINSDGEVLGYSFTGSGPYHERIGIWDHRGVFRTHYVQTDCSNRILFNNHDEIVITAMCYGAKVATSYLVPSPGVRVDIADLVQNPPSPGWKPSYIQSFLDNGDMLGFGFLLQRMHDGDPEPGPPDDRRAPEHNPRKVRDYRRIEIERHSK